MKRTIRTKYETRQETKSCLFCCEFLSPISTYSQDEIERMIVMKTLNEATTDELFTALMKKVQQENPHHCYYIDALTVEPYPTWTMHHVNPEGHEEFYNIVAKEVEISDCNLH